MRYAFIERHRNVWPISAQCRVLDVSVSGFGEYRARQQQAARTGTAPAKAATNRLSDMALLVHIRALFVEMKGAYAYGWPRIWRELAARGVRAGKERVRKLMQANGLRARGKKKFRVTTDSGHGLPVSPNLLERRHHLCLDGRKLALSGGGDGSVQPPGRWLFDGRADDAQPCDRCPAHGLVPPSPRAGADLPFGSRQPICERGFPASSSGLRHEGFDEPQGRMPGQRCHRNAIWLTEGRTASRHALCHAAAGKRRDYGLADVLQRQAASLDTGLHEPDDFREKEACRGKKARRMIKHG